MSRRTTPPKFRRHLIALAAIATLNSALALDLADSPPGTVQPYVAPNVIISIDDSGSMGFRLDQENATGATNNEAPDANGTWPTTSRRLNVLKHSLTSIFNDHTILPDKKIRLGWQAMWNNGNDIKKLSDLSSSQWYNRTGNNPGYNNFKGANDVGTTTTGRKNNIRILDATHRSNFIDFVNHLLPKGSTPSHAMFKQADEYMRKSLDSSGPWASDPGAGVGAPYLGCRRNYHIFMTDGRWNGSVSGGSQDDNTKNVILEDDTVFGSNNTATQNKTKLYADKYSDNLADWAFYSWATPLQPYGGTSKTSTTSLYGKVEQDINYRKAPETENFGKDFNGNDATLERYWNPRYNPATWPHLVTYTIGFSNAAITWPGFTETQSGVCKRSDKSICAPSSKVPFSYDGSFPDLITGAVKWPKMDNENKRSLDLWHAALNGRGRFYAVEKGEDLEKAFREIFQQINTNTGGETTTSAISGTNTSRDNVGRYTSKYEPRDAWKGYIYSETIDRNGNIISNPDWGGKNTADKLDARKSQHANRLILTWKHEDKNVPGRDLNAIQGQAVSFEFNNLSDTQKTWMKKNAESPAVTGDDTDGSNRVNYIRGDTSNEGDASPKFRRRISIQGDIVNSVIWYTSWPSANLPLKGYAEFAKAYDFRTPMLYVGGNDGMLHGFSAIDGEEKIAYVPKGAIPKLRYLTSQGYDNKHQFFVDGSPMTGDVDIANTPNSNDTITHTPDWRTLLVGTMGAGGKGYFVLDVTNPGFSPKPARAGQAAADVPAGKPASNFSVGHASDLVIMDRTRSTEMGSDLECANDDEECLRIQEEERDIGHITAEPVRHSNDILRSTQITRMNNNRWAVVMGNGYNSYNQRPVLLVQYLDGNKELLRIPAVRLKGVDTEEESAPERGNGLANDNGLAAPRLVDLNGDDRPDIAYAGDNLGNLWKFDLTSYDASEWGVAFNGSPLFTATGPAAYGNATRTLRQPISVAPTVRANDRTKCEADANGNCKAGTTVAVGGMMVAFGTGRNVARTDPENGNVQTLYSILDNTRYRYRTGSTPKRLEIHPGTTCSASDVSCVDVPAPKALGTGVGDEGAKLLQQTTNTVADAGMATLNNDPLSPTAWGAGYNGWYLDFPSVSERLLKPMEFYDGSNILVAYSQVPAKGADIDPNVETCDAGSVDEERQYRTFINIMDGATPSIQLMAVADGTTDIMVRRQVRKGAHSMITGREKNMDIDTNDDVEFLNRMPETTSRPSWRQMQ